LGRSQDEYTLFALSSVNDRSPIEVELDIDGVSVRIEIDTGASLSLVSEATFTQLWPGRCISNTSSQLVHCLSITALLRVQAFVNKTSCVHNIWYTGISITITKHSQAIPTIASSVENRERKRLIQLQRSYRNKLHTRGRLYILALETNHLKQTTTRWLWYRRQDLKLNACITDISWQHRSQSRDVMFHAFLALLPGLLQLQFLIVCSMQKKGRRPGESWKGEGLGNLITWSQAWLTSRILDTTAYSHSYSQLQRRLENWNMFQRISPTCQHIRLQSLTAEEWLWL